MIHLLLAFILTAGPAEPPQTSRGGSSNPGDDVSRVESVKLDEPVLVVHGVCKDGSEKGGDAADCKTVVTRKQFEELLAAVALSGQTVPSSGRQQFAQAYADLLAYAQAARSAGTESSPLFQELMNLIRLRTLAEIQRRALTAKYRTPSSQEIDDYYRQNLSGFIEIKLSRIMIPRKNPAAANQEEYEKRALEVVQALHARAVNGEDLNQLQKEGYAALGLASPPGTDLGNRRKANLVAEEREEILGLNVGGVSQVEWEAYSFVIYKAEQKTLLPEEAVKDEISRDISRQQLENALKEVTAGVRPEFNQQYFKSAPSPAAVPPDVRPVAPQPSRSPAHP